MNYPLIKEYENTPRRRSRTASGDIVDRQYLYLSPEVWRATENAMQASGATTVSEQIAQILESILLPQGTQNDRIISRT